jgi:hypothetical protein
MEPFFNILFNLETNEEIITYKKMHKEKDSYSSYYLLEPKSKPLGSFLLEFLNTDMHKRKNVEKFITEYCFERYYAIFNKNFEDKYINYTFTISEEEYLEYLDKIYEKFGEDFIWIYDVLWDIAMKKYRYLHLYENNKFKDPESSKYNKNKLDTLKPIDYFEDLDEDYLKDSLGNIIIDFNFNNYFDIEIPSSIPFAYKSTSYEDILYLSFRQIASSKYLICKCENCGKFFIPYSNHDTKYCDNIFKGNKTCKDLAPEIVYKQKLEQDPLLKKYRARYQSLQKSASLNPESNTQRYENFKKIGAIKKNNYLNKKITARGFKNWIESIKIKK